MLYVAARFQALRPDVYEQIKSGAITHVALCFDAAYGILASLIDGELTYRQYLEEKIFSRPMQHLRGRIKFRTDAEMHRAYYADYQYGGRVHITMDDGTNYVEERRQLLGARDRPFDHAIKFQEGASNVLAPSQVSEALAMLRALDGVDDIRTVMYLLQPQ